MKNGLKAATAIVIGITAIGSGHAVGNPGLHRAGVAQHYSLMELEFFSGSAMSSGREAYAAVDGDSEGDMSTSPAPSSRLGDAARHFSSAEYLFFAGTGFDSGAAD